MGPYPCLADLVHAGKYTEYCRTADSVHVSRNMLAGHGRIRLISDESASTLRSGFFFVTTADVGFIASDWTLLVFNLSHLINVLFPLKSRTIVTSSRIRAVIVLLVILAVVTWLFDYIKTFSLSDGYEVQLHGRWLLEWSTVHAKGVSFVIVFTFFAILSSNVVVILFLLCRYKSPQVAANTNPRPSRHIAAVRLLVLTSCMNAILKAPFIMYELLENLCAYRVSDASLTVFEAIRIHSYFANYSLGFFVYCLVNPDYGKKSWKIVTRFCKRKAARHVHRRQLTQLTSIV
ncbi:uncharacterized protein LOC129598475 isoform X2 [Paramacrobiotus metropolitanus]|uniref:uncharacterized protein LOC129598475 isoform X2 n=1 Tax=Paramacrobiotus metropolitanus TaxID=2943436 RepID=UPI002445B072|nr:uncharacterized protein LOC129598475 isoform X2 [Paramacrobiotus metropolitanus]